MSWSRSSALPLKRAERRPLAGSAVVERGLTAQLDVGGGRRGRSGAPLLLSWLGS